MTEMRLSRRPLGKTGLSVSPLGLASLSIRPHGPSSRLAAEDVERAFHEHGINTFLVHLSMKAQCEGVRRLIRDGHRDELVLASAVSLPFAGSVRRGLEKHLLSLGTDRLDVWLIGWLQWRWYARQGVWSELTRLREQGKARAIGYSSHNRTLAARIARELRPDVLMVRYNAAHRGAEREVFAALADLGPERPGIIAYTATRWGMLLKPLPKQGFPRAMTGPECYRFVLGHPAVDAVWCAASTTEELSEDVQGVLKGPLEPDRFEQAKSFGDAVHAAARGGARFVFGSSSS